MILQLGTALSGLLNIGASYLPSALSAGVSSVLSPLVSFAGNVAQNVGGQLLGQELSRLITKNTSQSVEDAIKKQLQAQSNAISPIAAPGNVAVGSGGLATGSAYTPPTIIPTSISTPQIAAMNVNPNFVSSGTFVNPATVGYPPQQQVRRVGLMDSALRGLGGVIPGSPPTGFGQYVVPPPEGFGSWDQYYNYLQQQKQGGVNPLSITPSGTPTVPGALSMANGVNSVVPSGLPAVGRYMKEPNGCRVQWYFWDGSMSTPPVPVDRDRARDCIQKGCIYRLDVFKGRYIKLGSRRMNPMNVRAFFRAGRRVDAAERIARKMFTEKRKQKTGSVRRKSRSKAKR